MSYKLIVEQTDKFEVIEEATKDGRKNYYIEGVFMQEGIRNRNGRIYPEKVLTKEVSRYIKECVDDNRAVGELGHPDGPALNPDRISHRIISLTKEGKDWIGKALILDTTAGLTVQNLLKGGVKLGVSSRGMGTLKNVGNNTMEVQEDFYLATAADIVMDPSAPKAFVNGIMEGVEWEKMGDGWVKKVNGIRERLENTPSKRLQEQALLELDNFFKSLK